MVNDDLLTRPTLSDEEWRITPEPDALTPDSIKREQRSNAFRDRIESRTAATEKGPNVVVLTHGDADGLTSAALLQHLHSNAAAVQTVSYHGSYRFQHALDDLLDVGLEEALVYICDFNPPDRSDSSVPDELHTLIKDRACDVVWYDHHPWADGAPETYRSAGVQVVRDTDECTASLIAQESTDHGYDLPDHLAELAAVTRDIDLWIRDDPRSPRLNVYASLVDDPTEYVQVVLEHGVDLPDDIDTRIDERIARNARLEKAAVEHASYHPVGEDTTLAFTYTRAGRSSEIGNELVETPEHDTEIAVVLRATGSAGIYSHSDGQGEDPDPTVFARCDDIAALLGGGGHPTASGFPAPVETFRELANYWATAGKSVYNPILSAAIETVDEYEREQQERQDP